MPKSVIVIDDDEDTVRLFSEFLEENGINVIGNGFDGVTAVKLFKETNPDVVYPTKKYQNAVNPVRGNIRIVVIMH